MPNASKCWVCNISSRTSKIFNTHARTHPIYASDTGLSSYRAGATLMAYISHQMILDINHVESLLRKYFFPLNITWGMFNKQGLRPYKEETQLLHTWQWVLPMQEMSAIRFHWQGVLQKKVLCVRHICHPALIVFFSSTKLYWSETNKFVPYSGRLLCLPLKKKKKNPRDLSWILVQYPKYWTGKSW